MARRGSGALWFLVVALVLIGVAAVTAGLVGTGRIALPFFAAKRSGLDVPPGSVAVPLSAAPIPAYTQITRDHMWDAKNQRAAVVVMRSSEVPPGMLTEFAQIRGRVLARDKGAGYVFTDDDFLPPGTRPGLVAGIPSGKRAVRLRAEQVSGIFGLRAGDRVDLVATIPLDTKASSDFGLKGVGAAQLAVEARVSNWQKQATVRTIVQDGMIVQPLVVRQEPVATRSLTQGVGVQNRPVQEVVIAVEPAEVPVITEALAVKAEVAAIPRSGRPDDPRGSRTPDLQPWTPFGGVVREAEPSASEGSFSLVEKITGSQRDLQAVPRR